jgi:hypothetical protein
MAARFTHPHPDVFVFSLEAVRQADVHSRPVEVIRRTDAVVFLANSEFAVISIHATRTNCRNPAIFRFSNAATQIETGLFKGESENRQSDALSHCSVLFACLTLTTAELHAAIGV